MTDREAMQQALEALVWEVGSEPALYAAPTAAAIAALRERLAHCDRCGKRLGGTDDIHTCSPQQPKPAWLEQPEQEPVELCERICAAIKSADDKSVSEADYMLDSDDCIEIVRAHFVVGEPTQQQRKPLTDEGKDAARWRFLVDNSFDKEGVTQFHVWEHSWEPHSQTGEPTEWKQRVRGPALDRFIDRAIEAAHGMKGEA